MLSLVDSVSSAVVGWRPVFRSRDVASARLRCFLPCRYLNEAGAAHCEIFDEKRCERYDVVVFQKIYDTESVALVEKLSRRGVRTVFDLCDNHFYNPHNVPLLAERAIRLRRMIESVDAITVSTAELAKVVPGRECHVVDDALEPVLSNKLLDALQHMTRVARKKAGRRLKLVWFGVAGMETPPFGLIDLGRIVPDLEALNRELPLHLTAISNSRRLFEKYVGDSSFPVTYRRWSRLTCNAIIRQKDVCLIPADLNPLTICKTSNRLLLALRLGLPVVASRIPSYEEFGETVLFEDWAANIRTYAECPEMAQAHVTAGRERIRKTYNKERVVSQWGDVFASVLLANTKRYPVGAASNIS